MLIGCFCVAGCDPTLKHALLESPGADTINSTIGSIQDNLLFHTSDQDFDSSQFEALEPPLCEEDYMFSLEPGEGITNLFDIADCDISLPSV